MKTLGRRTQRTASDPAAGTTVSTTYVCLTDASGMGQVISEYDEGELVRQSTYGSYIDEPLTLHVKSGSGASQTYWYHQDRQYNIVGLSDDSGTVIERYAYSPYGERRVLDPDGVTERSASDFGNARGHQGLWHDDETGLKYNRGRYYNVTLGRWMGRDLLGYVDGMNLYEYVMSQPLMWLDYNGWIASTRPGRDFGRTAGRSTGRGLGRRLAGAAGRGAARGGARGSRGGGAGFAIGVAAGVGFEVGTVIGEEIVGDELERDNDPKLDLDSPQDIKERQDVKRRQCIEDCHDQYDDDAYDCRAIKCPSERRRCWDRISDKRTNCIQDCNRMFPGTRR